ncbi:MAG: hypothetical protein E3J56_00905 [Candidatus Aminicenantes bacterium]|nr:MAG: hypothetical protein E3J56_00905 [Candidatus Aminicenantes bacterium]
MIKTRKIDKLTHHVKGRVVLSGNSDFPSAKEDFLRALEVKILESAKKFKHSGIVLEFMNFEIK